MAFALDSRVRDVLSRFDGIVVGYSRYLYSNDQVQVQPHGLHDGKPIPAVWFDAGRLEQVEDEASVGFSTGERP